MTTGKAMAKSEGTKATNQPDSKVNEATTAVRIYCDGAGVRPDNKGSSYAWLREDTGQTHLESLDGLTNNQAEYKAIYSALENAPKRSHIEILSDSALVINQLTGEYHVENVDLMDLRTAVLAVIQERELTVKFQWIPRGRNRADKLTKRGTNHGSRSNDHG